MNFENQIAESTIIAKLLMVDDPHSLVNELSPEDFTNEEYRSAFTDLTAMLESGTSLKGNPMAMRIGMTASVKMDGDMMVSSECVKALRNLTQRRSLLDATVKIGDKLGDNTLSAESLMEYATAIVEQSKDERVAGTNVSTAFESCSRLLQQLENPKLRGTRIDSGMPFLDNFGPMYGGDMITIAGRTGAGKTAFAKSMALSLARNGTPVGYICKEMTDEQFTMRMAAEVANVDSRKIASSEMSEEEKLRYMEALAIIAEIPFVFSNARTIESAMSDCRRWREKFGTEVFFFDYAQQFGTTKRGLNTRERIMHTSESIKFFGLDNGVVTVPLAQMNRSAVNQGRPIPPRLDHLKESGCLEEDSDRVYMLWNARKDFEANGKTDGTQKCFCSYRKGVYEMNKKTEDQNDLVALFCRKYRGGAEFTSLLEFVAPTTSFRVPKIYEYDDLSE